MRINNKSQAAFGVLVVLLIIVGGFALVYFYKPSLLSSLGIGQPTNISKIVYYDPITFSAALQNPSLPIYPNSQFNVIITLVNHASQPIAISVSPAGCPFVTSSENRVVTLGSGEVTSFSDSFSASKAQECTMLFTACFDYTSSYQYFFSFENENYNGVVPVVSSIEPPSPFNISISNIEQVIPTPPTPNNETYNLILNPATMAGYINNGALKWLSLSSTSEVYIASQPALNPQHTIINITGNSASLDLLSNGALQLPFILTGQPVVGKDYSSLQNITVTAGYTYCMQSSYIPISIQ